MNGKTPLFALLLLALSAPAFAVYKCEAGGKVTYTDTPCDGGKLIEANHTAPADTGAAKREADLDQHKLKKLEGERHRREALEQRDLRKASHASAARQKKCANLARRQARANEEVARTAGIAGDKAKRKARHAADEFVAQCGQWYDRELGFAR
ncbi:MAG TPA: DUF4124 domain-containing protein [Noviherbaspirillum sp.]|uniref:DUF4124 domain-containing protein n=1 Tax=Noviherbaspirillum sp. TaxID=1926288 RepID=UPI002D71F167|nr:DUF4124 domain-containing protein [Noviherbaspirillum sp.]HYD94647.1 DUF4124 domain-containing protein [Noviherbaspirillum sp.]